MRIPIFGILSSLCAAFGIYLTVWYHDLPKAEREEADRLAAEYAMRLYNKGLEKLNAQQLGCVNDLVKGHFKK
jgi:hypothetical protein